MYSVALALAELPETTSGRLFDELVRGYQAAAPVAMAAQAK